MAGKIEAWKGEDTPPVVALQQVMLIENAYRADVWRG
jgi:hypothetical protein